MGWEAVRGLIALAAWGDLPNKCENLSDNSRYRPQSTSEKNLTDNRGGLPDRSEDLSDKIEEMSDNSGYLSDNSKDRSDLISDMDRLSHISSLVVARYAHLSSSNCTSTAMGIRI